MYNTLKYRPNNNKISNHLDCSDKEEVSHCLLLSNMNKRTCENSYETNRNYSTPCTWNNNFGSSRYGCEPSFLNMCSKVGGNKEQIEESIEEIKEINKMNIILYIISGLILLIIFLYGIYKGITYIYIKKNNNVSTNYYR